MRLLGVEGEQIVSVELGAFAGEAHQNVLDDIQPGGSSRMDLIDGRVVQFVHVELEDAFFGANQEVLVSGFRVDPRGGAVNAKWTTVEDLGEAGAHEYLGCGR